MKLSLDEHEISYLKQKLPRDSYWVAQHLLNKILAEEENLKVVKNCQHKYTNYIGKKTCCVYCGAFGEDMGESWTLKDLKNNSEIK